MPTIDPSTGRALPDSAIQRVLFASPSSSAVHVYQIPPLTSTKGFTASAWTSPTQPTARQIFACRVRIVETSVGGTLKADIVLEDPSTGDLFAAAPYTSAAVVQQALDSSRFFAVRVVGDGGMKATLGIGFEERSAAFDFGIALGEVRKVLGMDVGGAAMAGRGGAPKPQSFEKGAKQDFSLKEGEKITIQVGGRGRRTAENEAGASRQEGAALFSIAPPPPPAAREANGTSFEGKTAEELGFDDGEFGEFQ